MRKQGTRTWVLLSVLLALITLWGIVRARNSYFDSIAEQRAREVGVKQDVAWVIEGVAASTRTNFNGHKLSDRAIAEGVGQLSVYTTVFLNHDHNAPVGRIVDVRRVKDRILIKVEISKAQSMLWQMIREGVVSGFSVGSFVIEESYDWDNYFNDQVSVIERAYIFEVSVVFIPANPDARITGWYIEPR